MKRVPGPIRDHPFELLIAWLCLVTGPSMALAGLAPNSIIAALPGWEIRLWGSTLGLGGALIVIGITVRYAKDKYVIGALIERAGYMPLVSGTVVFSVVILSYTGIKGLFPCITYAVFAGACAVRYAVIGSVLRRINRLDRDDNPH